MLNCIFKIGIWGAVLLLGFGCGKGVEVNFDKFLPDPDASDNMDGSLQQVDYDSTDGSAFISTKRDSGNNNCEEDRDCDDAALVDPGPACSDGHIDPGEACDDGNAESGDGCTANCKQIEANFVCPTPGQSCVSTVDCGDGIISGDETCDDSNTDSDDGCDEDCQLEEGWACPIMGIACEAAQCGDELIVGKEECEDGNTDPGDGCDDNCRLEDGYVCDTVGESCETTLCGDAIKEGSERCDDGNNDMGDGCTPLCQLEPDCSAGACISACGDGIKFATEDCDDGNTLNGDGCSSDCEVEAGYACQNVEQEEPDVLVLPLILRDYQDTFVDMEMDEAAGEPDEIDNEIVADRLGTESDFTSDGFSLKGKPIYKHRFDECDPDELPGPGNWDVKCTRTTYNEDSFHQWYRDQNGTNITFIQNLLLHRIGSNLFQFDSAVDMPDGGAGTPEGFFPLDDVGYGNSGYACNGGGWHNFYFTSEVRYWFEYDADQSDPTFDFSGDDDVFVFVNGKLVPLDLGGVHSVETGSFTLDDQMASDYDLQDGNIYEMVVFQAERNVCASNYKLTLSNFLVTHSECESVCGDSIVTKDEVCDDGINDGSYGGCMPGCRERAPYCGDAEVQSRYEACDDGVNLSDYGGCAPGCVKGPYCGDGEVQSQYEACDDGDNKGEYDGCAESCVLGPRCGDGEIQFEYEECDDGNRLNGDGCNINCQQELIV